MQELELTGPRIMSVWWCIAWRGVLGGLIVAFAMSFLTGFISASMRIDASSSYGVVIGSACGIAWSFVVLGMALRKRYAEFRIALVAREP